MRNLTIVAMLVFTLLPTLVQAEGKIGGAYLMDQDKFSGYRAWVSIYEPVIGKLSLGAYGQHEQGPQNSGRSTYLKVGGYYDITQRVNFSIFGESTHWTDSRKTDSVFDSKRVGVGVEYKLW